MIVNKLVYLPAEQGATPVEIWTGWQNSWYIFAGYALAVAVLFWFLFPKTPVKKQ
jgi:hypothetical protein